MLKRIIITTDLSVQLALLSIPSLGILLQGAPILMVMAGLLLLGPWQWGSSLLLGALWRQRWRLVYGASATMYCAGLLLGSHLFPMLPDLGDVVAYALLAIFVGIIPFAGACWYFHRTWLAFTKISQL